MRPEHGEVETVDEVDAHVYEDAIDVSSDALSVADDCIDDVDDVIPDDGL